MILLLLTLATAAPTIPPVPCWAIRAAIELYGQDAMWQRGRSRGYSDAQMEAIRKKCGIK